jgi:hypothetical protein
MKSINVKNIMEKGGLMIEALAMLGLIAVVTPTMYKKSAERTMEIEDINTATTIRTISNAAESYVSANYSNIIADMMTENQTSRIIAIDNLREYLPYGFDIDKSLVNYGTPKIGISRPNPTSNSLTTIFELAVKFFNSSFNFFLLNNVFSIEENTLIIFPPVLFKIVRELDTYLASSISILLANLSKTVSTDKPYFISRYIFSNS